MSILEKKILGKKFPFFISYIAFAAITLIAGISLLAWTLSGEIERAVVTKQATIMVEGTWQEEYLVGQTFKTQGLSLNIGSEKKPRIISIDDCTISADFSSAGEESVEISYKADEYTVYAATKSVNVLPVRGLYIENYSDYITLEGEKIIPSENFEGYAVLGKEPQTNAFGEVERVNEGWKIRLREDTYSSSCKQNASLPNFYTATIYCGSLSHSFNFFNAAEQSFVVGSINDIVTYKNDDENSQAKMQLVVTDRDSGYQEDCTGETKGYYIYQNAEGEQSTLPFRYSLEEKAENLLSETQTAGLTESSATVEEELYYAVSYAEESFSVSAEIFQSAVVGGRIYEDHGYKLVVNAKERILHFDYTPVNTADPKDPLYVAGSTEETEQEEGTIPTLTLYVTDYDMNPLLGTGNGWSKGVYIYTDRFGQSHKLTFYLQAWVWTYVPLSGNRTDVYDEVTVSDFVYNYEAPDEHKWNSYHQGTFYATVSQFIRGEGFVEERFSVADAQDGNGEEVTSESKWLPAILGM